MHGNINRLCVGENEHFSHLFFQFPPADDDAPRNEISNIIRVSTPHNSLTERSNPAQTDASSMQAGSFKIHFRTENRCFNFHTIISQPHMNVIEIFYSLAMLNGNFHVSKERALLLL